MFRRSVAPVLGVLVAIGAFAATPLCAISSADAKETTKPAEAPSTLDRSDGSALPIYLVTDDGPDSDYLVRYDQEGCSTSYGRICCEESERFWIRGDYLLWWTKGTRPPPLVTMSPDGTSQGNAGVLPGATILYPTGWVNADSRSGYRVSLGYWLDACRTRAIEGDYWDLGPNSSHFVASGEGSPILARPFRDSRDGDQNAELVSFPGLTGTVTVNASDYFQSAGAWFRCNLKSCQPTCGDCGDCGDCGETCEPTCESRRRACGFRLDMLAGYRHYRYNDSLTIHEDLLDTGLVLTGTTFDILDSFRTHNEFHGGEIGVSAQVCRGRWSLDLTAKAAFGNNRQVVTIDGQTILTIPDLTPIVTKRGLLTGDSNIGQYSRDRFVIIPQFGAEVGYALNCNWRAYAGYNFLYWANVQRAASQIDFNVDPGNSPPAGSPPLPQLTQTDFWAQGLNVGLEFRH
jgi:hypothetical protein